MPPPPPPPPHQHHQQRSVALTNQLQAKGPNEEEEKLLSPVPDRVRERMTTALGAGALYEPTPTEVDEVTLERNWNDTALLQPEPGQQQLLHQHQHEEQKPPLLLLPPPMLGFPKLLFNAPSAMSSFSFSSSSSSSFVCFCFSFFFFVSLTAAGCCCCCDGRDEGDAMRAFSARRRLC